MRFADDVASVYGMSLFPDLVLAAIFMTSQRFYASDVSSSQFPLKERLSG